MQYCGVPSAEDIQILIRAAEESHELNLYCALLTEVPEAVWELTGLRVLMLDDNQLTTLPPEIGNLRELRVLSLISNELTALPPEIGNLRELRTLNASSNQLTTLPPEFGQLDNLRVLHLSNNRLKTLPAEFAQLQELDSLMLVNNNLTVMPQVTVHQRVYLSENPLPAGLLAMNANEQAAFLQQGPPPVPLWGAVMVLVVLMVIVLARLATAYQRPNTVRHGQRL